jgi:hypothetical protein
MPLILVTVKKPYDLHVLVPKVMRLLAGYKQG